jgi:hypothetical protein
MERAVEAAAVDEAAGRVALRRRLPVRWRSFRTDTPTCRVFGLRPITEILSPQRPPPVVAVVPVAALLPVVPVQVRADPLPVPVVPADLPVLLAVAVLRVAVLRVERAPAAEPQRRQAEAADAGISLSILRMA